MLAIQPASNSPNLRKKASSVNCHWLTPHPKISDTARHRPVGFVPPPHCTFCPSKADSSRTGPDKVLSRLFLPLVLHSLLTSALDPSASSPTPSNRLEPIFPHAPPPNFLQPLDRSPPAPLSTRHHPLPYKTTPALNSSLHAMVGTSPPHLFSPPPPTPSKSQPSAEDQRNHPHPFRASPRTPTHPLSTESDQPTQIEAKGSNRTRQSYHHLLHLLRPAQSRSISNLSPTHLRPPLRPRTQTQQPRHILRTVQSTRQKMGQNHNWPILGHDFPPVRDPRFLLQKNRSCTSITLFA